MNTLTDKPLADIPFREYSARQNYAINFENIHTQAMSLRPSDKFTFTEKDWVVSPYHGFAIVSMVNNNYNNKKLTSLLNEIIGFLDKKLNPQSAFYMLPEHSFHQTVANTLSDKRYFDNIVDKGLTGTFPDTIENAFHNIRLSYRTEPLQMRMTGLNVFGSCVALLGVFDKEEDYDTIISFRKQFYGNPVLQQSGIRWTRPFIGHITLAYLGRELNHTERLMLEVAVNEVNVAFDFSNAIFFMNQTELRSYTDLSCFNTTASYPAFSFVK